MKYLIITISLLPLTLSKTTGQLCHGTAQRANDGNWYCSEVKAITYRNISQAGVYNRTTTIDRRNGLCSHERVKYPGTGPLTPLFGELSMHLRGPMNVSQLAVYQIPPEAFKLKKRDTVSFHDAGSMLRNQTSNSTSCSDVTTVTSTVFVTEGISRYTSTSRLLVDELQRNITHIDIPLPSLSKLGTGTSVTGIAHAISPGRNRANLNTKCNNPAICRRGEETSKTGATQSLVPSQGSVGASSNVHVAAAGESWSRVAYYTSTAPAQATGFAFLANKGDPQKSGTFDYAFGNSLSYVISDGSKVATRSTPFGGTLNTSEVEIAVLSDKKCDEDCEYWRPNATAHYGWSGESKAFLIEFQMDHYENIGSDQGLLSDAPAWWFLNAAIPRILQYGNDRNNKPCSCWSTGCGEFDAFEVLGRGEERAKSTIHRQGNLEGGDSNYFKRPVGRKTKFGVFFYDFNITARVLSDDFVFGESLSEGQIGGLVAYEEDSWVHSLFPIGD